MLYLSCEEIIIKVKESMNVVFNNESYEIDEEKIIFFASKLEKNKPPISNEKEILQFMKKYRLFDEVFFGRYKK